MSTRPAVVWTPCKFTGKERDGESGLDYFLARHYSSTIGRFIEPDEFSGGPIELFSRIAEANPTFYADPLNPQSLNKYSYAYNNPLRYADPMGHGPFRFAPWANAGQWGDQISPGGISVSGTAPPESSAAKVVRFTFTLEPSGQVQVDVEVYSFKIPRYDRVGAVLDAVPSECGDCRFVQTVIKPGMQRARTDQFDEFRADGPVIRGTAPDAANVFFDRPSNALSKGAYYQHFVTSVGFEGRKSFRIMGSFTWGYDVTSAGKVSLLGPRLATATEQEGHIQTLRRDYPDWRIHK